MSYFHAGMTVLRMIFWVLLNWVSTILLLTSQRASRRHWSFLLVGTAKQILQTNIHHQTVVQVVKWRVLFYTFLIDPCQFTNFDFDASVSQQCPLLNWKICIYFLHLLIKIIPHCLVFLWDGPIWCGVFWILFSLFLRQYLRETTCNTALDRYWV